MVFPFQRFLISGVCRGVFLCLFQDTQEISAPELRYRCFIVTATQQFTREVACFTDMGITQNAAAIVEIRTYADMLDADQPDSVIDGVEIIDKAGKLQSLGGELAIAHLETLKIFCRKHLTRFIDALFQAERLEYLLDESFVTAVPVANIGREGDDMDNAARSGDGVQARHC